MKGLSDDARAALHEYSWPGNVRELANVVERAVILARGDVVQPEDFALTTGGSLLADALRQRVAAPSNEASNGALESGTPKSLRDMERNFINESLQRHNGQTQAAAMELGLSTSALSKKIREHQLD